MQVRRAFDVEYADIRVVARDTPQMPPYPFFLQFLRHRFLIRLQPRGALSVHVQRQIDGHLYVKQHRLLLVKLKAPAARQSAQRGR